MNRGCGVDGSQDSANDDLGHDFRKISAPAYINQI